VTDQLTLFST